MALEIVHEFVDSFFPIFLCVSLSIKKLFREVLVVA